MAVTFVIAGGSGLAAQESSGQGTGSDGLLLLVTEKLEYPDRQKPRVNYWWSNPKDPQWTATDRALRKALRKTDAEAMRPPSDVRISRIYRTPELSLDNAASLASILGARRIVLGEVTYVPTDTPVLPGYDGLEVEGTLQVVDVTTSEPSVIRTLEVERSVFMSHGRSSASDASVSTDSAQTETASSRDGRPIADRARTRLARVVGSLLDRTVLAASGEVGVDADEPLLSFHNLGRGRALEMIRGFLSGLDTVEGTRVHWASEGRIAVEINPAKSDGVDAVRYAARTLVNESFDRMAIRRMKKSGETASRIALAVELADNFDEPRRRDEETKTDE